MANENGFNHKAVEFHESRENHSNGAVNGHENGDAGTVESNTSAVDANTNASQSSLDDIVPEAMNKAIEIKYLRRYIATLKGERCQYSCNE